jgi:hypothetical protein
MLETMIVICLANQAPCNWLSRAGVQSAAGKAPQKLKLILVAMNQHRRHFMKCLPAWKLFRTPKAHFTIQTVARGDVLVT